MSTRKSINTKLPAWKGDTNYITEINDNIHLQLFVDFVKQYCVHTPYH